MTATAFTKHTESIRDEGHEFSELVTNQRCAIGQFLMLPGLTEACLEKVNVWVMVVHQLDAIGKFRNKAQQVGLVGDAAAHAEQMVIGDLPGNVDDLGIASESRRGGKRRPLVEANQHGPADLTAEQSARLENIRERMNDIRRDQESAANCGGLEKDRLLTRARANQQVVDGLLGDLGAEIGSSNWTRAELIESFRRGMGLPSKAPEGSSDSSKKFADRLR